MIVSLRLAHSDSRSHAGVAAKERSGTGEGLADSAASADSVSAQSNPNPEDEQAVDRARSALRRTASVAERISRMDPDGLVRIRPLPAGDACDLFFSTPLGCIISQRIPAVAILTPGDSVSSGSSEEGEQSELGSEGAVIPATGIGQILAAWSQRLHDESSVLLGEPVNLLWSGTLPPQAGYAEVDRIPAGEIRRIHAEMGKENQDAHTPSGIARSLLDQALIEVTSGESGGQEEKTVRLTGRLVAALGGSGIVSKPVRAELQQWDLVRVSATGSWIRIDGLFGSLYAPRPGGLARVPMPS